MRPPRLRVLGVIGIAAATAASALVTAPVSAAEPSDPFISELHYDNTGTDTGEFVEVQLPAGTSSEGLSVVLYNGNGGASYGTMALPPMTAPSDGPAAIAVDAPGLQNGSPDGLALVRGGTVLEFLSYEGSFTATSGPAAGTTSTDIGVSESGSGPAGESLSKRRDPATGDDVWNGPARDTRGTVNPAGDPPPAVTPCDVPPTHEIGEVQGSGSDTPLEGQQVTVRGTVVADLSGLGGFHVQDVDGDGTEATSDGIFVASGVDVGLGDSVAVTGGASDRFGQTQISAIEDVEVCAPGTPAQLPAAAPLDLPADDAARERLEGMLVAPADTLTVSEVFQLTRFGELMLAEGGMLVQPTEVARPGPGAAAVAAQNALRRIVLDDGRSSRTSTTNRPYLTPATPVRVGDELTFTSPVVLGYGFNQWRLQPSDGTAEGTFAPNDTRPASPDAVGGDVTVGAFNVLNYFLTLADPPGRGADDAADLEKQATKIVRAIQTLDADVTTLMEIEDTDATGLTPGNADTALADLVRRLNTDAGFTKWASVPLPLELYGVDRDVIRNAIVYQVDRVRTVSRSRGLVDESVWYNAREPIAQAFKPLAQDSDNDLFVVVANHFKSKSPGSPTGDNVDSGDGQGAWNGDRTRQARSLAGFTADLQDRHDDSDVLVMGDLNAYTREDPVEVLREAGFTDLGSTLDEGRYSYVFNALSGSLDHAMATSRLTAKVTGAVHWNINAVESFAYQYSGDPALYAPHAFRSSDHDPVLVGLDLGDQDEGDEPGA